jgi:ribosomal protein S18 acetylase RimI-like enzyme
MMSFSKIIPDQAVLDLYKVVFPLVSEPNGLFGDKAEWYGLKLPVNDEVVAFYTIGHRDHRVMLYNVCVAPQHRHQGYGQRLMKELIKMYGDREIFLFVNPDNRDAMLLYQRFKFREVKRVYVPPKGEICMKRGER